MANLKELTAEDEAKIDADWAQWAADRPQVIKDLAARFKPWKLYRMKSTGQRVVPSSFFEDNTLTVAVRGEYNLTSWEFNVFGVSPDDLEECDLPHPGEPVGVYMNEEQQLAMVNERRAQNGLYALTKEQFQTGDFP